MDFFRSFRQVLRLRPNFLRVCIFLLFFTIERSTLAWVPPGCLWLLLFRLVLNPSFDWIAKLGQMPHSSAQLQFCSISISILNDTPPDKLGNWLGWLAAAAKQGNINSRYLKLLPSSVGPASPYFLCRIISLFNLINDTTSTQFHPSYSLLVCFRKFACYCLSGKNWCALAICCFHSSCFQLRKNLNPSLQSGF